MRTVSTLCASGAGISLSAVGLTLVRPENPSSSTTNSTPQRNPDMTAVATYTIPAGPRVSDFTFNSHRSISTPHTPRLAREREYGRSYSSNNAHTGEKRSLTPRASFSTGAERLTLGEEEPSSQLGTPISRPQSWLRRFSSSMSTSRDSSRTPTSRPASAAVSQSNGSVAFSSTGSTAMMFPDNTTTPLPPNKLVKRSSSVRSSISGSPYPGSGSRLPLPIFRRPATSHQRSATLQGVPSVTADVDPSRNSTPSSAPRDPQWRHYFTPRVAPEGLDAGRRRSSTGIPNPIRRVYPDRKYTPVMVAARELVNPAQVELDDGISIDEDEHAVTKLQLAPSVASSPMLSQAATFEYGSTPKRSFSIGDLLSTGPQPLWKRPTSNKSRTLSTRLPRRGRPRVASAPVVSMGSSLSNASTGESERPAKRRDITDPQVAQRSIYSSSGSSYTTDSQKHTEIQLNLGSVTPLSHHLQPDAVFVPKPLDTTTPSPPEQRRLPSATAISSAARPTRVSATQSEITSTIDSDSEWRSVGGYSTDYQSDTVYDSFPTRTTRSTSGKRGPPIDTIFDESPPTFSSGRSTKLKDLLSDGNFPGSEHSSRYRHSTIEEEGSVLSTPKRSLHDKSVTSTPSARPGAQQLFGSSPPVMGLMPDPDEMDWDAPDDKPTKHEGLGLHQHNPFAEPNYVLEKSVPFRLSAFSRSANAASAQSTPARNGNGLSDRSNLFDWSEQQPSPSHHNQSPPRPRTVHGKKDPENRGSRSTGRRAPSGMHARSHSVPVVPDVEGKRSSAVANKFGTWGVGSKGVTEDWNEDFDFEEPPLPQASAILTDDKRIDSGHEMFVPKSIREQQENVVANISLLREWGLLIEELKELRIRAVALGMLKGPYASAWNEVDAMIELADQESEEDTLQPRRSPPSSPGLDLGGFDEPLPAFPASNGARETFSQLDGSPFPDQDSLRTDSQHSTPPHSFAARPRKDSEAVARTVIAALQSKRSISDSATMKPAAATKKVPFDTGTLRHIVPYVNGLKRKVKEALRETEGLYSSPRRRSSPDEVDFDGSSDEEPAFRSIFNEPQPASPVQNRRSRKEPAAPDHDGFEDHNMDQYTTELTRRMQGLSLPQ